jgi:hypothetical protein
VLDRALAQENRSKEVASLNLIVLTCTSYVIMWIHRMMRVVMYMLLNLHGRIRIRHILALLLSRFIEIGETR